MFILKTLKSCLGAPGKKKAEWLARTEAYSLTLKAPHKQRNCRDWHMIRYFFQNGKLPEVDNTVATCNTHINGAVSALEINDQKLRIKAVEHIRNGEKAMTEYYLQMTSMSIDRPVFCKRFPCILKSIDRIREKSISLELVTLGDIRKMANADGKLQPKFIEFTAWDRR